MQFQTIPRFHRLSAGERPFANRRWLLVLCHWSLVLLLVLTGCGGNTPTPVPASPTSVLSPLPSPVTSTPTREAQPVIVILELWLPEELDPYGDGPGAAILARQLADFSRVYQDLQVEVIVKKAHGRGGLLDFLRAARDAAPSVLPDLVVLDAADLRTAAGSDLIQPLDQLLSSAEMAERFPFAVEMETVDGRTMGFVIGADMQHLAYRPAVLESPPASWTQVLSSSESLLFPAGGRDRQVNDATLIQYLAVGGKLTDEEGKPALDGDALAGVLDFYSDCMGTVAISPTITPTITSTVGTGEAPPLITPTITSTISAGVISPTVVLNIRDADQAWELFKEGEGGMTVVWASRYWLEADGTMAPASIPTRDGYPLTIARREWVVAMVADDPARQALALLLLEWLITPDHNGQWTRAAGYLPGARSALRAWNVSSADRAVLRSILDAAVPAPDPEVMAAVGPAMQEALVAVLRRRATPEEAAASAVQSLAR